MFFKNNNLHSNLNLPILFDEVDEVCSTKFVSGKEFKELIMKSW